MIYIQHSKHGVLAVADFTDRQRENGWKEIPDIGKFLKEKKETALKVKRQKVVDYLSSLTKPELLTMAEEEGVKIEANTNKPEIIQRMMAHDRTNSD